MAATRVLFPRLILFASCLTAPVAFAQTEVTPEYSAAESSSVLNDENAAPVRMAYFSYVKGEVFWRINPDIEIETPPDTTPATLKLEDEQQRWTLASVNLPLRAGMEVLTRGDARAELCFDDGSLVRIGSNTHLALDTMSAEADNEFTALRLDVGLAMLKLKQSNSLFQLQAASTSISARGPAALRVGASTLEGKDNVEVSMRRPRASRRRTRNTDITRRAIYKSGKRQPGVQPPSSSTRRCVRRLELRAR